jgi:acyl-CoA synthetase (AMP-forming)/AMP-acid ligase II
MNDAAKSFADYLDAAAALWPQRDAIVFRSSRLSFGDISEKSRRVAAGLAALGVKKGDRVGLWLENGEPWVLSFWALARLGAIVVPLSTRWTATEARGVLRQVGLTAMVVGGRFRKIDFLALLAEAMHGESTLVPTIVTTAVTSPRGCVQFAELATEASPAALARVASAQAQVTQDDIAQVQFTSGSTAFPKGAMLRQGPMLAYVHAYGERMGLASDDRLLCQMPFFHIAGINHAMLVPPVVGSAIVSADVFDPALAIRQIEEESCTAIGAVATMYFMMADQPGVDRTTFRRVGKAWCLGSPQAVRRVHELTGIDGLVSLYGCTEMSGSTTFGDLRDPLDVRLANVGRSLPGFETRIVDPATGVSLAQGLVGEICHRSASLMSGYFGLDRSEWNVDPDGWLHTGDLGVLDANGYLTYHGRHKDMLKIGGENVACPEVEDILLMHPAVRLAAVVGIPHERLEEVPVAFVELRSEPCSGEAELLAHCARHLASFKVPRRIVIVDALPMTGSNKLDKPALKLRAREMDWAVETVTEGR